MFVHVAKLALAPILYSQAKRMHATAIELPEPDGVRSGRVGEGALPLRLLVTGDSSAVGVGANTQEDGFAIPFARALSQRLNASIHWQLIGQTGLTSEGVLQKLTQSKVEPADVALVTLGTNDITREVSVARALRHRAEIVEWLRRHAGVRRVVFSGLPEIQRFPAIPQPLAWYAGLHARRNNRAQQRWASAQQDVHHADISGLARADLMAVDGYHPAPKLYTLIAERIADYMARQDWQGEATRGATA